MCGLPKKNLACLQWDLRTTHCDWHSPPDILPILVEQPYCMTVADLQTQGPPDLSKLLQGDLVSDGNICRAEFAQNLQDGSVLDGNN